jgi:hypothetical protein
MIVAVGAMGKVQVTADEIIHMIAMRNGLVPTSRSMAVRGVVTAAGMGRSAGSRILAGHVQGVLVDMVAMDEVEVAIVQVVGMVFMGNRLVAAVGSMLVSVVVMDRMGAHCGDSFRQGG